MTLSQSEFSFSFDAEGVVFPGELPDYPELPSGASSNAASSVAFGPRLLFSMYSDGVWVDAADGAQAVKRGHAGRGGGVGIGAAAGLGVGQVKAQLGGDGSRGHVRRGGASC